MKYYKTITATFCFWLASIPVFSQIDTLILSPVNNLLLNNYNLRKMAADKENNLWFGTDKGLVKFDGNDLTVIENKQADSNSLSINSLGCIFFDHDDNIYVFGVSYYIDYVNTKTGKVSRLKIQLRDEDIQKRSFPWVYTSIYIENDSSLWAGVFNIGFLNFNRHTNKTVYYSIPKKYDFQSGEVYIIREDFADKNKLWLGTDDGIYLFNKTTKKLSRNYHCANPKDSTNNDLNVRNLDTETRDTIWFSVNQVGLACYDIGSGNYTVFYDRDKRTAKIKQHNIDLNEFQRKNDHEIYVTSEDSTPGVFNTRDHTYNYFTKLRYQYPSIQQKHYLADRLGNFWSLAFYQLYKGEKRNSKFQTVMCPHANKKSNTDIFKLMLWNNRTKIYTAVFDGKNEVILMDTTMKKVSSIPIHYLHDDPAAWMDINDALLDKNGNLWLCGGTIWAYDSILKRLNPVKTKQKIDFTQMELQNMVERGDYIYFQPSKHPFHAIYRININTFDCDSIALPKDITSDTTVMNQRDKSMDVLEIDKKGELAYLCYGLTLYQLNLVTKQVRKIITYPPVDKEVKGYQHFYNMFWYKLDNNENLWVATLLGINIYDRITLKVIKEIPKEKDAYPLELFNAGEQNAMCYLYSNGVIIYDYKNNREFKLSLADGLATIFNSGITVANNMLFIGAYDYFHWTSFLDIINDKIQKKCFLSKIAVFNQPLQTDSLPAYLHTLTLPHNKNSIAFTFSATEFDQPERLEYRYKLINVDKNWVYVNYLNRTISYNSLKPGHYTFLVNIKNTDGTWSNNGVHFSLTIVPAWWQTTLFKVLFIAAVCTIVYLFVRWRIQSVRKQEQVKGKYEKELLELEAKALRAQMNPHFIFNCMNSIKSLIQKNDQEKSILYLTTFSKLIRTVFQNSDKREITLYDEVETCKLYMQLESMRFKNKFSYEFNVDETLDLKSIRVPALIIQPFIENAIWHGIMPKEEGGKVTVSVTKNHHAICCSVDDDGIGRETSKQNKFLTADAAHESKGEHLTQARLDLDNLLNEKNARIEIIDKKNDIDKPAGTLVIVSFNED